MHLAWIGLEFTTLVVNPTTIQSWPWQPPSIIYNHTYYSYSACCSKGLHRENCSNINLYTISPGARHAFKYTTGCNSRWSSFGNNLGNCLTVWSILFSSFSITFNKNIQIYIFMFYIQLNLPYRASLYSK